ncbi:MAG TPA: carbohydrate binding domain-containing protein [Chitinispirillaceae bacterium]|nr:carbohydrate binding domain-containing protein [Chitinispirillaceae bacterium]
MIGGIPDAFGTIVNAKVEYVPWKDKDTPVSGPATVSTTAYTVSNGSITVPVNVTSQFYGYRVYLTPASINLIIGTRGRGTVSCSPDHDNYEKDSQVSLTATPSEGWVFNSWSGDASGNQNPLTVTMNTTKSIIANFTTADGKQDLVLNGDFSSGNASWTFNNWSGSGTGSVENGEYKLTISSVGDDYSDIQVVQPKIVLEQGKTYRLMYDAYASANRVLNVNVGMPVEPWTTFLTDIISGAAQVNLATSRQTFILDFVMEEPACDDSRVEFSVGLNTPTVYLDNISLFEIPAVAIYEPVHKKASRQIDVRQNGNLVKITFNTAGSNALLSICDLKGNIIRSARFKASDLIQNYSFNISGIANGFYIMRICNGTAIQQTGLFLIK